MSVKLAYVDFPAQAISLISFLAELVDDHDAIPEGINQWKLDEVVRIGKITGLLPWMLRAYSEGTKKGAELSAALGDMTSIADRVIKCELSALAESLNRHQIDFWLLKGGAYKAIDLPFAKRLLVNDVDILIDAERVDACCLAMHESGFSQRFYNNSGNIIEMSLQSINESQRDHYELFPFSSFHQVTTQLSRSLVNDLTDGHPFAVKGEDIFFAMEVDIHFALSHGISNADAVFGAVNGEPNMSSIRCLSPETHIWFVASRFYHETMLHNRRKLRPLVEISYILNSFDIEWDTIINICGKYQLWAGVYYVLKFLHDFKVVEIPIDIIHNLEKRTLKDAGLHNWGDFTFKLFGHTYLLRPER